jgi:hypothetical protein
MKYKILTAIFVAAPLAMTSPVLADGHADMSFFLTSIGSGDGANLGGLAGADAHCTALAEAASVTGKEWAAYLSSDGVDARDRIGSGPWINYNGVTVATDVDNLHDAAANALSKENSISETGAIINGRGDKPNMHDILTGSDASGMTTGDNCAGWTSNGEGSATVGHHDRTGGGSDPTSWNAAHPSRGCSQANLQGTGGNGLFYCFAKN